jgi:murein DD-endopeptidase MepM/ murein hydrolase activator NlpD
MKIITKIIFLVLITLSQFVFTTAQAGTLFRLPLASNPGYRAWFDHNTAGVSTKRYDCTTNIDYDGHDGTDFAVASGTTIYSGAAGELYVRVDNCPDQGSMDSTCGGGFGNHVKIKHLDQLVSIYAHMKKGTPAWPQSLLCGVKVGLSGNSGQTSGAHFHFGLWKDPSKSKKLDFFKGSCNSVGYWVVQNNGWPTKACQSFISN